MAELICPRCGHSVTFDSTQLEYLMGVYEGAWLPIHNERKKHFWSRTTFCGQRRIIRPEKT